MITYNPVTKNGRFQVSFMGVTKTYKAIDEAQARFKFAKENECFFPLTSNVMSDRVHTYFKRDMQNFPKLNVIEISPTERVNGN